MRLTEHDGISRETVRRRLAENELKPWREKMWCVPKIDGEYVARMENVLDLYAEPPDPKYPVVCLDESPVQLIGEVREPIAAAPGQIERVDYEYRRCGTVNLFVAVDAHRPWRKVSVTQQRTAQDYAERLRELVDVDYPGATCIRVVQDNLSTHTPGALQRWPGPGPRTAGWRRTFLRRPQPVEVAQHCCVVAAILIREGLPSVLSALRCGACDPEPRGRPRSGFPELCTVHNSLPRGGSCNFPPNGRGIGSSCGGRNSRRYDQQRRGAAVRFLVGQTPIPNLAHGLLRT